MRSRTLIGTFLHRQSSPIGGGDSNANHKRISFWGLLDQIRALIQSVRGKKYMYPATTYLSISYHLGQFSPRH